MAKELRISFQGAATIYAVIRRISDAAVWNGSALAAWSDGSIATYAVALANTGGDFYSANMPAGIPASDYRVVFYQQAGGAPAITDYIVGIPKELHWDGTAASSVSSVTPSAYALATLAQVKQDLGITDGVDDTALTEDINQVTALIEGMCRRKLMARSYRQRHDGSWQASLVLKNYPVQHITRVSYGAASALTVKFTGSALRADVATYRADGLDTTGGLRLVSVDSVGVSVATNLSFASYPTVALLVAAIGAVSGWTATTVSNQPSADINPGVSGDALGRTVTVYYPDQRFNEYVFDAESGILELKGCYGLEQMGWEGSGGGGAYPEYRTPKSRFVGGFKNFVVEYRAGYESVPDDLNMFAREEVKARYEDRQSTNAVKSESVGPFSADYDTNVERCKELLGQLQAAGYVDVSKGIA